MLPTSVRIAGFDYEVNDQAKHTDFDELGVYGDICYQEQKIRVQKEMPADNTISTFTHEVTHGIQKHFNIPVPEDHDMFELVIDGFGAGWFQVLKENPAILILFLETYHPNVIESIRSGG